MYCDKCHRIDVHVHVCKMEREKAYRLPLPKLVLRYENDNIMTISTTSYHLGYTKSMSKVVKRSCIIIPENLK